MAIISKEIWVKIGYETFAMFGPNGLKIEKLAKQVGKSKSSFYHHFVDLELFIDFLLKYHLEQSKIIALKEQNAQSIDPDLIHILLEHKIDLLFNRQLRIYKNVSSFASALDQFSKIVGDAFIKVWVNDMGLKLSSLKIEGIFTLALENFYLQINTETINNKWLSDYFKNLKNIALSFV